MEIKNPKYIEVMNQKCDYADRLIKRMLTYEYAKSKIEYRAYDQANVVYESMGTLNVTKKQARTLQKMADNRVQKLVESELMEEMVTNPFYVVK